MFENDSIHAFQRSTPKRTDQRTMAHPNKRNTDNFIMDTNNSSIVSKRSVEKLYYASEPEYFRYFVNKFKRRSPLINRGYWLRMKAVENTVKRFLQEPSGKRKVVINLGCGYDPLPWLFLGKHAELCHDAVFVDVDYPQLMCNKVEVIAKTEQLHTILPHHNATGQMEGLLLTSDNYLAIGCDLRNLDLLTLLLDQRLKTEDSDCSVAILFVAEVSIAYMDYESSQEVLRWATHFENVRFCLLEQHLSGGADHPFAQTMLKHFEKLRTPLRAIGTMRDMHKRFEAAGWPNEHIDIRSLWDLWSDDSFISSDERQKLNTVEPFDEWEEFALFASHYFLLVAKKVPDHPSACNATKVDAPRIEQVSSTPDELRTFLHVQQLPGLSSHRRFGAALPMDAVVPPVQIAIHAGLGTQERQTDYAVYGTSEDLLGVTGPPLTNGLMCHTITRLHDSSDVLLVGGRTSPDRASSPCWLRQQGSWEQVQNLPQGRYRHCAVSVATADHMPGVIVYGGKTSDGTVLDSWLLWSEKDGWQELAVELQPGQTEYPAARFGAAITDNISNDASGTNAVLVGGMSCDGTILEELWFWSFDNKARTVSLKNESDTTAHRLGSLWRNIPRLGGSFVRHNGQQLLVGGIIARGMLTRNDEIISLDTGVQLPMNGPQPLLVGHNTVSAQEGLLVVGGGATCFSFGTYWNPGYILHTNPDLPESQMPSSQWHLVPSPQASTATPLEKPPAAEVEGSRKMPQAEQIGRTSLEDANNFSSIMNASQPIIITDQNIGPCKDCWSVDYLKQAVGADREVVVHSSPTTKMDFQTKNFRYTTQSFGSFLDAVERGDRLYLRALSRDAPSERPTSLATDFPEIAADFELPPQLQFVKEHAHSSPLRISGPVTMWLHYDVMANVLCQVRGRKRLLLFPPSDVTALGFEAGASSSSMDVFDISAKDSGALANTHPHEALLEPGDILFIPALWLHSAAPTGGMSVAVNVFFRHLDSGYAAGRDVYGNRDLAAYEKGRKDIAKIVKTFDGLPVDMRRFYVERLATEMRQLVS